MRTWIEPAGRDMAEQARAVREILHSVLQVDPHAAPPMEVWRHELGNADEFQSESAATKVVEPMQGPVGQRCTRTFYELDELARQFQWAKSLAGDTQEVLLLALRRARDLGQQRLLAVPPALDELASLARDFPNFHEVVEFVRRRALLCGLATDGSFKMPPLLLNGPPGTGKTAFSQRLARALSVPITVIDVSTLDTSFKVTGLDAGYSTGRPGLIWDALSQECMSPVVLLDELDKPGQRLDGGLDFLLGLLEPVSARRFQDAALRLPVDASHVLWIATCNDLERLDAPLRSRFRRFDISAPDHEQMHAVISSVFREMRATEEWAQAFDEFLPGEIVTALAGRTPREIRQDIEEACAQAAAQGRKTLRAADLPARELSTRRVAMGFV